MIIGYVTLGTNDLTKVAVFYDAIAAELDTPRMMNSTVSSHGVSRAARRGSD